MGGNIKELNKILIEELKEKEFIRKKETCHAFSRTERHKFLPYFYKPENGGFRKVLREEYMADEDLMQYIYSNRSIVFIMRDGLHYSSVSSPAVIAIMSELADIRKGHKILEIGAGSGYNAAILSNYTGDKGFVFTIEIDDEIFDFASANIDKKTFPNIYVEKADGGFGLKDFAPYDRIIVSCSTADITKYWIEQLKKGGIIVAPLITRGLEAIVRLEKKKEDYLEGKLHRYVHFYTMRGAFSILSHYSYTKKELKSLDKIISMYSQIDDEFADEIMDLTDRELNDFFLFLSLRNSNGICYFTEEIEKNNRGYGLFLKTPESGIAVVLNRQLHVWGNRDARNIMLTELENFRKQGKPDIESYTVRVYTDPSKVYESPSSHTIFRKNSVTVFTPQK